MRVHKDEQLDTSVEARRGSPLKFDGVRTHLIGIGGSGMSGAAGLLLGLGARVAGSDAKPFEGIGALVQAGARVSVGHSADMLDPRTELVVASAAIPETNPELIEARKRNLTVVKYAEFVGMLMKALGKGVAVAGTHGKSTTTAMCVHLFREAGLDPSFLVGAKSKQLGGSSGLGKGAHFVVESCEYDRSFLHLAPESAVILNIETDHLDCYKDINDIRDAFGAFARNVPAEGLLVCNGDDPRAAEAARFGFAKVETFGFSHGNTWQATNLCSNRGCFSFDVKAFGKMLFSTRTSVPGRHNVANALAAIALAHHAGAAPDSLARALPGFSGIDRRLSWCGEGRGVTVIDDYAHHPTEIKVSIAAARSQYEPRRTWVVFQPHQHSRTRLLMDEFATSFADADEVIVPDVFDARGARGEGEINGSAELVNQIRRRGGRVRHLPNLADVTDHLTKHVAAGDLVLTMGAGDIWKVADELVERIRER